MILASNSYGTVNMDLWRAFVEVIKKIRIKKIEIHAEINVSSAALTPHLHYLSPS